MIERIAIPSLVALTLVSADPSAQVAPASLGAASTDLPGSIAVPFESPDGRLQQLYAASELGFTGARTVRAISLRFDGPTAGPRRTHRIRQLDVWIGVTSVAIDAAEARFAANLSQPLEPFASYRDLVWTSDDRPSVGAEPFGSTPGTLRFAATRPITLSVPAGGCLVVELRVTGNDNGDGRSAARLDGYIDTTEVGTSAASSADGVGCAWGDTGIGGDLDTPGTYLPGGVFELRATGFPPGTAAAFWLTTDLAVPTTIPGTPRCWSYLDLATGAVAAIVNVDPTGRVGAANGDPVPIPIPRTPVMCDRLLYVQGAAPAPLSDGNPTGVMTSSYRTIKVGCRRPAVVRGFLVTHDRSADAAIGTRSVAGGVAIRIE